MNRIEFTPAGYENLLELVIQNDYKFSSFENRYNSPFSKNCLLRHDIDVDLYAALELARIEYKKNVKSTFFLMFRSPIYNLFSRANDRFVREIIDLGHDIALHFDAEYYVWGDLQESIDKEADILYSIFKKPITTVSFHQPNNDIICNNLKINDYINTYDKQDLKDYAYFSDSNKMWYRAPEGIFTDNSLPHIQLLIHPMWWVNEDPNLSTREIWKISIARNFTNSEKQLLATERAYGNKSIFYINDCQE